jgi:hypothetical protein
MSIAQIITPIGPGSSIAGIITWGLVSGTGPDVPPTLSSATIATDGNSITLAFSEAVTIGAGGSAGFTLSMAGGACTITYSSGTGTSSLVYTTSRTITQHDVGTLSYVQPGNGIEDLTGNDLASFSNTAVVNNSTVNTTPTDILLSNSSVSVAGGVNAGVGTLSTVDPDYGDTFTYTLVAGTGSTNNASFNIAGTLLRCNDPNALGLGTYSVRIQTSDGTASFAKPFTITVVAATTSNHHAGRGRLRGRLR